MWFVLYLSVKPICMLTTQRCGVGRAGGLGVAIVLLVLLINVSSVESSRLVVLSRRGTAVFYWLASDLRMAWVSSATAVRQNSNWLRVPTMPVIERFIHGYIDTCLRFIELCLLKVFLREATKK